jgi:drug/metabolite transporter (DMT)-like permease
VAGPPGGILKGVSARTAAALVLALSAAFLFALSNVLEQREAEQLPDEEALRLGLVAKLARRPRWLAGFGIDVGGYVAHAAALGFASLVFVQPLLVTSLVFALLLRSAITGQPLRRRDLLAALVLAAGLAFFLLGVSRHGGRLQAPGARWALAAPWILVTIVVCVAVGRRRSGPPRALLLGLAAGVSFGVTAALTKTFVHLLGSGVVPMLQHWEPYALAVTTVSGLVLAQSSFQAGSLAASIAALEVAEPAVATALGIGLFEERIHTNGVLYQVSLPIAMLAILVGIIALSRATTEDVEGPIELVPDSATPRPA